jgi:hypothetical protein
VISLSIPVGSTLFDAKPMALSRAHLVSTAA